MIQPKIGSRRGPMTGDTDTLSDLVAKITQAAARAATDTATALDLGVLKAASTYEVAQTRHAARV
jgi:hypothetical protein